MANLLTGTVGLWKEDGNHPDREPENESIKNVTAHARYTIRSGDYTPLIASFILDESGNGNDAGKMKYLLEQAKKGLLAVIDGKSMTSPSLTSAARGGGS